MDTPGTEQQSGSAVHTPLTDPSSLMFAGTPTGTDIWSGCPHPVQTFTLWQAFLQNVNPLSKVVYAPQVQDLIVKAAGDFNSVSAPRVALLFAIYAAAVASWSDEECRAKLGESKQRLLQRYLANTQRALAAAGFLRVTSLILLQAYTIYLLAARQSLDTASMWILTGIAMRVGTRLMSSPPKPECGSDGRRNSAVFETEMRRRVWWQIQLIDGRQTQLSGQKMQMTDTLDVPLPANINDSDMSPGMTAMPAPVSDRATEMLFCLMRYELGRFLQVHGRELHDPATPMARRDALIDAIGATYESRYLRYADPALPLHHIARAGARSALAKMRLMAHHPSQYADRGRSMRQPEHDLLFDTATTLVEALVGGLVDNKQLAPFQWHIDVYFQLDALVFLLIESKSQPPEGVRADTAWQLVDEVFRYRPGLMQGTDELSVAVRQLVTRAWEEREQGARELGRPLPVPPPVVVDLRDKAQRAMTTRLVAAAAAATRKENRMSLDYLAAQPEMEAEAFGSLGGDVDMLGWTMNWDSWEHWDALLQSQTPL